MTASTGKKPARKVLIIVENLPVPFDRRVWSEATTLQQAGYGVSVICPKGKDAELLASLASVKSQGSEILCFHMEGPFLTQTGALPPEALGRVTPTQYIPQLASPGKRLATVVARASRLRQRLRPMGCFHDHAAIERAVFGQLARWHKIKLTQNT